MEKLGSFWTDFHGIWHLSILRKSVAKLQVLLKSDKIKVTLREDQYAFLIISRSFFLRMRNISDKCCRENQNTHFAFINLLSYKISRSVAECHAVWRSYKISRNTAELQNIIQCGWVTKYHAIRRSYKISRIVAEVQHITQYGWVIKYHAIWRSYKLSRSVDEL